MTFTPTDTVDYSPAESMVTLTVNPAPIVTYTLTTSTQSVSGSTSVTLGLTSTNYVGTVSFQPASPRPMARRRMFLRARPRSHSPVAEPEPPC